MLDEVLGSVGVNNVFTVGALSKEGPERVIRLDPPDERPLPGEVLLTLVVDLI